MKILSKDGRKVRLRSEVQVKAFLKAGWKIVDEITQELTEEEKLAALREEADALGVDYHPNIGYEKLLERVNEHKARS